MVKKIFFLAFFIVLVGCKSTHKIQGFSKKDIPLKPNYNNEKNWAVLPNSSFGELKEFTSKEIDTLQADVFYVYPTLNTENDDLRWNVPVEDIEQQNKVLNKAVLFQASAFATSGKLYVPYYRQAHLRSYKMLENGGDKALLLAYSDVKKAFEVYLKNYNKGRPIIIASHSQGSTHAKFLLRDFFDNKPLQEKLIAAYIVGTVLKSDLFSLFFHQVSCSLIFQVSMYIFLPVRYWFRFTNISFKQKAVKNKASFCGGRNYPTYVAHSEN